MKTAAVRIVASALFCLYALFMAACGSVPEQTESTTAPPVQTTFPTAETTRKPTDTDDSEAAMAARLAAAPALEGAVPAIGEIGLLPQVVYTALEDNPYGVEAGTFLGIYKAEVFLGEDKTGGVALVPSVLLPLLARSIDALPEEAEPWLLPLPVDLTGCTSHRPVRIDRTAQPFSDDPYYIRVSMEDERLGVSNIVNGNLPLVIDSFWIYDLDYVVSRTSYENPRIVEGQEMSYLFVVADLIESIEPGQDDPVPFGTRVGYTEKPVLCGLSSVRGPFREHTYDCLLYLDECPVFVACP